VTECVDAADIGAKLTRTQGWGQFFGLAGTIFKTKATDFNCQGFVAVADPVNKAVMNPLAGTGRKMKKIKK